MVYKSDSVIVESRIGKIKIYTNRINDFIGEKEITRMHSNLRYNLFENQNIILLELEVLDIGKIKLNGIFACEDMYAIITDDFILFPCNERHLFIQGKGDSTVINCVTPDMTLFDLQTDAI